MVLVIWEVKVLLLMHLLKKQMIFGGLGGNGIVNNITGAQFKYGYGFSTNGSNVWYIYK